MKRNKFIKYLDKNGCSLAREGGKHSLYKNTKTGKMSTVPRHTEMKENLCRKICKDLGIPDILKRPSK
ncbi:MAG: type II toxin-antitoxin system HicA family toxin [Bacteroidales bacterium]|nr:type II toxin-antitoxin system HicA family toxin [Bacteroidales bacterium]